MSSILVLNVDKQLPKDILSRELEVSCIFPWRADINEVDAEIAEKIQHLGISGFSYILGNQFMSFQKTIGSFFYEQESAFADWLQKLVTDLITRNYEVSLIPMFYGDGMVESSQIQFKTMFVHELTKDNLVLDYYTVYKETMQ